MNSRFLFTFTILFLPITIFFALLGLPPEVLFLIIPVSIAGAWGMENNAEDKTQ